MKRDKRQTITFVGHIYADSKAVKVLQGRHKWPFWTVMLPVMCTFIALTITGAPAFSWRMTALIDVMVLIIWGWVADNRLYDVEHGVQGDLETLRTSVKLQSILPKEGPHVVIDREKSQDAKRSTTDSGGR